MSGYDAVLLAGGTASRLGGVDKPALRVDGVAMLDRVLAAVASAQRQILVGPMADSPPGTVVTREDPPGGGPVAAIAAGLAHVTAPLVAILAADLPFLMSSTVDSLLAAAVSGVDVAVLLDDAGHDQLLIASWRTEALRTRLTVIGDPADQPVRRLFDGVMIERVTAATRPGQPPPWLDCDTEDDLRRAREWS